MAARSALKRIARPDVRLQLTLREPSNEIPHVGLELLRLLFDGGPPKKHRNRSTLQQRQIEG